MAEQLRDLYIEDPRQFCDLSVQEIARRALTLPYAAKADVGHHFAVEIPVQYDRQIVIFEAAQRAKGKIGDHAEIAVRQFADIGERAAAGARIDASADDASAEAVEFDRQRPVEHPGRVDIVDRKSTRLNSSH